MTEQPTGLVKDTFFHGLVTAALATLNKALEYYSAPAIIERAIDTLDDMERYIARIKAEDVPGQELDEKTRRILDDLRESIPNMRTAILRLSLEGRGASLYSQYSPAWCGLNPLKKRIYANKRTIDLMRQDLLASTESLQHSSSPDKIWNIHSIDMSTAAIKSNFLAMLNWLAEALPQMPLDPIELPHLVREPNDIESNPVQNAPGHQSDRSIHSLEWTAEINTEVTSLRSRATGRTGAFNPTGYNMV